MNSDVMIALGFRNELNLVKEGKCPFCKEEIKMTEFKNELSKKEYKISGLCQKCQDETFS